MCIEGDSGTGESSARVLIHQLFRAEQRAARLIRIVAAKHHALIPAFRDEEVKLADSITSLEIET